LARYELSGYLWLTKHRLKESLVRHDFFLMQGNAGGMDEKPLFDGLSTVVTLRDDNSESHWGTTVLVCPGKLFHLSWMESLLMILNRLVKRAMQISNNLKLYLESGIYFSFHMSHEHTLYFGYVVSF